MNAIARRAGCALLMLGSAPALAALPPRASYDDAIRCAAVDMIMAGMLDAPGAGERDRAIVARYKALAALWLDDASRLVGDKRRVLSDFEARGAQIMARLDAVRREQEIAGVLDSIRSGCASFEQAYAARGG